MAGADRAADVQGGLEAVLHSTSSVGDRDAGIQRAPSSRRRVWPVPPANCGRYVMIAITVPADALGATNCAWSCATKRRSAPWKSRASPRWTASSNTRPPGGHDDGSRCRRCVVVMSSSPGTPAVDVRLAERHYKEGVLLMRAERWERARRVRAAIEIDPLMASRITTSAVPDGAGAVRRGCRRLAGRW